VLVLPLVTYEPPRPPPGGVQVTTLDVGQGMAVAVRTHGHILVYDTGPRYGSGFNTGDAVVVPFLRHWGVGRVDRLVLSHSDIDHVGGAEAILAAYPKTRVLSGEPSRIGVPSEPCLAGTTWTWDGVRFDLLHPATVGRLVDNDASCVLRIEAAGTVFLLPGDISRRIEGRLVGAMAERLRAQVLVAPHHGSRTSSSRAFISAVAPQLVVFPVGYRNHYGFPAEEVLDRYRRAGPRLIDTATQGAIDIWVDPDGTRHGPTGFRFEARRYWTGR
jgi:competence protein ComEC